MHLAKARRTITGCRLTGHTAAAVLFIAIAPGLRCRIGCRRLRRFSAEVTICHWPPSHPLRWPAFAVAAGTPPAPSPRSRSCCCRSWHSATATAPAAYRHAPRRPVGPRSPRLRVTELLKRVEPAEALRADPEADNRADLIEVKNSPTPAKQPSMRAASCEGCGKGAAADKGRLWSRGAHQCLPYRQQFREARS
jgi:hypothetical protein